MCTHAATTADPGLPGAVTHSTSADTTWIDRWVELVLAEEDWVRREFDELIAYGWGGSGPSLPPTSQGTHQPRRPTPRHGPTRHRSPVDNGLIALDATAPERSRGPPE
jgi:hypothetical protein